jgi:hypothetical protein
MITNLVTVHDIQLVRGSPVAAMRNHKTIPVNTHRTLHIHHIHHLLRRIVYFALLAIMRDEST